MGFIVFLIYIGGFFSMFSHLKNKGEGILLTFAGSFIWPLGVGWHIAEWVIKQDDVT